jgi:hypothetical protein
MTPEMPTVDDIGLRSLVPAVVDFLAKTSPVVRDFLEFQLFGLIEY